MASESLYINLALKDSSINQQLKSINNEMKNLDSNYKKAAAGVKDFDKSEDGLNAKMKLQESLLEQTKKKLDLYNKKQQECNNTLTKVTESYAKQETKVKGLKDELTKAEQVYGKNSKEVKSLNEELKRAEKSFETKRNSVINANNALTTINTTINKTEAECRQLESEIRDLNSELDNVDGKNFNQLGNDMMDASSKAVDFGAKMTIIGEGIVNVGQSVKETGKEIVSTLGDMVEKGGEYQIELAAITTMLGEQEGAVRTWASTQADSLGMTEHQLVQVTAKNMMLAEKMGLTGKSAKDMAQNMSVVTQDLATFWDVDPTEMVNKFNSALNGSTEIMDQYGVDISVASLENSKYVKSLGKKWKALTEAEKKQARYNKILEDTAKVQGNAKKESEGFAVQSQLLKTNIGELVKMLGELLIPVLEPIVKIVGNVVDKLKIWAEENPKIAQTIMMVVGTMGIVLAVLGSLLVPIGSLIVIMGALAPAITAAGGVMAFFSASILPVIATIGAVIVIAAALCMAIKENWEAIKQATQGLIDACKPHFDALVEAFKGLWDTCVSIFNTVIQPLFEIIGIVIHKCIEFVTPIIERLIPLFTSVFNFINAAWNNILRPVFEVIMTVVKSLIEVVEPAFLVFKSVICGAMDAVLKPIQWVIDKLSELFNWIGSAKDKVSGFLDWINPFSSNEEVAINYSVKSIAPEMDNIALSGSYYNATTSKSREVTNFARGLSGTFDTHSSKVSNVNSMIEPLKLEIESTNKTVTDTLTLVAQSLMTITNELKGLKMVNLEDIIKIELNGEVKLDTNKLIGAIVPKLDKASHSYNSLALR